MIHTASELVTALIERYLSLSPVETNKKLFPWNRVAFRKNVGRWLRRYDRCGHFTRGRITHLSWGILHELTGGELAIACLVLGLHHPLAQVELFYSIMETNEAATLFDQVQQRLWGEAVPSVSPVDGTPRSKAPTYVGCRAFPPIDKVQETVTWLREGSEQFFRLRLLSFDPARDAELLNRAVLYAVWHQFFSFGTRAICSAYQSRDGFSSISGVAILSDKDFASGYKTRMILASERLRRHMGAIEQRLARLSELFPEYGAPVMSSGDSTEKCVVWLLDGQHQPVVVTPTTIAEVLKEKFPLPVNTPRKVMRYLLRRSELSHTHAEAYMGHWWHGREPFSPFSSFDFRVFRAELEKRLPPLLRKLGFHPVPGERRS